MSNVNVMNLGTETKPSSEDYLMVFNQTEGARKTKYLRKEEVPFTLIDTVNWEVPTDCPFKVIKNEDNSYTVKGSLNHKTTNPVTWGTAILRIDIDVKSLGYTYVPVMVLSDGGVAINGFAIGTDGTLCAWSPYTQSASDTGKVTTLNFSGKFN